MDAIYTVTQSNLSNKWNQKQHQPDWVHLMALMVTPAPVELRTTVLLSVNGVPMGVLPLTSLNAWQLTTLTSTPVAETIDSWSEALPSSEFAKIPKSSVSANSFRNQRLLLPVLYKVLIGISSWVEVSKLSKVFWTRTVAEDVLEGGGAVVLEELPLATCASTAALEREQKKAPIGTPWLFEPTSPAPLELVKTPVTVLVKSPPRGLRALLSLNARQVGPTSTTTALTPTWACVSSSWRV